MYSEPAHLPATTRSRHDAEDGGGAVLAGALALLAVQGFVWAQQRLLRSRSFEVMWLGFAVTALIGAAVVWACVAFAYRTPLSPWPGAMQYALTVAAFPALAFLLMRIERGLPRPA